MSCRLFALSVLAMLALACQAAAAPQAESEHADAHGGDSHGAAGAHDAHGAHIGAEGASTDPSQLKGDLAIYTFLVFLLLLAILWKFAWGPIAAGLDRRERNIADEIAAAARSGEEARQMLAQYERKLAQAQDEVRGIIDEARRDAQHTAQELLDKARQDAQAEIARGRREIETATAQALKELAETSANLAVDLAGKIVRTKLSTADHNHLVEEALASFPKGDPRRN